jgi:hypothetical protein
MGEAMVRWHHDLRIELNDTWWREAAMDGFNPSEPAYRVGLDPFRRTAHLIPIADIGPVRRSPGVGIFNDDRDSGLTAGERVVRLLRGFRLGEPIPPIEVVGEGVDQGYTYKLTAGTHRLYCSLVVGFTLIPAVKGFDITT